MASRQIAIVVSLLLGFDCVEETILGFLVFMQESGVIGKKLRSLKRGTWFSMSYEQLNDLLLSEKCSQRDSMISFTDTSEFLERRKIAGSVRR